MTDKDFIKDSIIKLIVLTNKFSKMYGKDKDLVLRILIVDANLKKELHEVEKDILAYEEMELTNKAEQVMYDAVIDGEHKLRTNAQVAALNNNYNYDVRTTVDGFPINLFYKLTDDSELVFIGKYNFNNDKSTESVFGFRDIPGFDNSNVECWEVLNNGDPIALFKTVNNFDKAWDSAFEGRYPDGNTEVTNLKAFCTWVSRNNGKLTAFKRDKSKELKKKGFPHF